MHGRLALNRDQVDECRTKARHVAEHLQKLADRHTTLAIEQAVLRAVGAASSRHHPIIHAIAAKIGPQLIKWGVAGWLGRTMVARRLSPEKAALYLAKYGLGRRDELNQVGWGEAQRAVRDALERWQRGLPKSGNGRVRNGQFRVAVQIATNSASQDIAALNRLRDFSELQIVTVPGSAVADGIVTEHRGFFRRTGYPLAEAMQRAATEGRRVEAKEVCWEGNTTPETAVIAASLSQTRLGVDPMSQLRRDHCDPRKVFADYQFLLRLSAKAGFKLQCDQATWGACDFLEMHQHQVLAMQIVMEQWGIQCGGELDRQSIVLPPRTMTGKSPDLISALATQQLIRELFSQSEIWHHVSSTGSAWDIGVTALIGLTGAVVPAKNAADLQQLRDWGQVVKPLSYEYHFSDHGHISRRMHTVLERCMKELGRLHRTGFSNVLSQDHGGLFAVGKPKVGMDSVFEKDRRYWNPLEEYLER